MTRTADEKLSRHLSFAAPGWLIRRLVYRDIRRFCLLPTGHMLDVGCGQMPYRPLFANVTRYTGIDRPNPLHPDDRPTLWADSMSLPFASASFDAALCTQVLEHVPEPALLLAEINRVLRLDGVLLLTAPHIWELHEQPYDFFRYTRFGLEYLLTRAGFRVEQIVPQGGLFVMLSQRLSYFVFRSFAKLRLKPVAIFLSFLINSLGLLCDRLYTYEDDTLNYLAVAHKRGATHA